MLLYVYSPEIKLLGIVEKINCLIWTRRHYTAGSVLLSAEWDSAMWELLAPGNLLYKGGREAAVITSQEGRLAENGVYTVEIRGAMLGKYLEQRIIMRTETLTGKAETCMRDLVRTECIEPRDPNRILPRLCLGEEKGYEADIEKQVDYNNLGKTLEEIGESAGLGYGIEIDIENRLYIFAVYKGEDRSVEQDKNIPCIFSEDFENITGSCYIRSLEDLKNTVVVRGEETSVEMGAAAGLERREILVDSSARRETKKGEENITLTDAEYKSLLQTEGEKALAENAEYQSLEAEILPSQAYHLGDRVTCVDKRTGLVINTQITEEERTYENGQETIRVTFGRGLPTLAEKLKRRL